MSIESIERFLEQIVLDAGIGVQNLLKKMKESNCQRSLQPYLSKNYISRLPWPTTFNYVLNFNYFQLLLLHYFWHLAQWLLTHNQLALCIILQEKFKSYNRWKGFESNLKKGATHCNSMSTYIQNLIKK